MNDLYQYLSTIIGETPPKTVRSLPPALFNQVVDMIMPSDEERSAAFTGRRIRHLSVMGFNTMGKPNIANPARDLFELLHIFDDCRKKEDWKNFFELLAHVVVKKSIFRDTPSSGTAPQQVHVGLLIPAPDSQSGQRRWYFNESFFDDGQGNVNYVLLPACDGYTSEEGRTLPMVKLYRSTASNKNAEDFQDSIAADLNPYGAPGSINPDLSFKYEREHFEQRTIPLWMGHLIMALRMKGWEQGEKASEERSEVFSSSYKEHLLEAGTLCKSYIQVYHPGTELMELLDALQSEDTERLEKRLIEYGEMFHENPRYKISQDIACVGHSLGAALSQAGIYYFSTHLGRIPVPGHQFICYSSDGPGVDNSKDAEFMRFGHRHRELFRFLHVGWKIYHQFEYGDIVAEAGESSLGTTGYRQKKDRQWLDESIVVFRPLPGEALPIITAPTHGRRIGMAEQEVDYTLTSVTPKELSEFHHSMWLRQKIRRIWGYKFLNSPRVSELIRRTSGQALRPEMKLYTYFERNGIGIRDKDGVLAVRYAPEETQVPHTL